MYLKRRLTEFHRTQEIKILYIVILEIVLLGIFLTKFLVQYFLNEIHTLIEILRRV